MKDIIWKAAHVTPSARQLEWQRQEFIAFVHFGPNTFTDRQWGAGDEDPSVFNPTAFDARQWVAACRDAGMRGLVLTAKHHDGFCLWPSRYTGHSVRSSSWKGGQGDVVREVAEACAAGGLRFGVYVSPWDRHEPTYGDSPRYNEHFKNQLRELLTDYGDIYDVWFDGACGEGPGGRRQVYDWLCYHELIRELQAHAVISICGPDVRWCGNEAGECRESEWSVLPARERDRDEIAGRSQKRDDPAFALLGVHGQDRDLGSRERIAGASDLVWFPAEVNTSIRPSWFYDATEDDKVKPLDHLLDIYYGSVGGNAVFLLNIPPDRRGIFHENDVARMRELGEVVRATFARDLAAGAGATASEVRAGDARYAAGNAVDGDASTYWSTDDRTESATLDLDLGAETTFDHAMLQEHIAVGQRVEEFVLEALDGGGWKEFSRGTVIGYKRLCRFDEVTARKVRLRVVRSRVCPTVSRFGLFKSP